MRKFNLELMICLWLNINMSLIATRGAAFSTTHFRNKRKYFEWWTQSGLQGKLSYWRTTIEDHIDIGTKVIWNQGLLETSISDSPGIFAFVKFLGSFATLLSIEKYGSRKIFIFSLVQVVLTFYFMSSISYHSA